MAPLPTNTAAPATTDVPATAGSPAASDPVVTQSVSTPSFKVVQTAHRGATYASTISVRLASKPAAGDTLVLFFEQNKTARFPYSGQVSYPALASGSAWSYDGGTSSTAILSHVVASGETGSYTLNVGGTGSGWSDYVVAEVSGANASQPVNKVSARAVAAGTTSFALGSGIAPTVAGTFPVAFFSAHTSGLSWSSISSGWTIANRNADYTEMLASGPVQTGTAAVNAVATLSGANKYTGSADVVLLNPASSTSSTTPTPTPKASSAPAATPTPKATSAPASTPTPTPAATAAPVSGTAYTWHGCRVYPANDWFTTDLIAGGSSYVPNSIDPNSAKIIANLNSAWPGANFNGSSSTYVDEAGNAATNSTAKHSVSGTTVKNDPYNDDGNNTIPWQNGYLSEGTSGICGKYDCHSIVVNTQTCVDYETYSFGHTAWNGSSFYASNGYVHNLNQPFNAQYSSDGGAISGAGVPMMGTTDFGEDASLSSINHILGIIGPGPSGGTKGFGGHVTPATNNEKCASYCTNALPYGGRLRLKASYVCPSASSYPQAYKVCNQLKHYGAMFTDTLGGGSSYAFRFGVSSNGSNPWNTSDLNHLLSNLHITDFDVMTLGTIH